MSTLLNKSYLVKVSTSGGGGVKNAPNSVHVVCTQPLSYKQILLDLKANLCYKNTISSITQFHNVCGRGN